MGLLDSVTGDGGTDRVRLGGRALALLWALGWVAFGVLAVRSGAAPEMTDRIAALAPGAYFLVLAVIPWKWEGPGAALLILQGLVALIGYPVAGWSEMPGRELLILVSAMGLPPLVAGGLLLTRWRRDRSRPH